MFPMRMRRAVQAPSGWPCPACGADASTVVIRFGDQSWLPGRVLRCAGCSLLYKAVDGGPTAVDALYQRDDFATHEYWSNEESAVGAFAWVLARVDSERACSEGSLLDIGCGPGTFPRQAARAGYQVTAIEPNGVLAQQARGVDGITVLTGRFDEVDLAGRRFDVITVLDVIEHLVDPVALLGRCRDLLNPGGTVVIYTPNHDGIITRLAMLLHRRAPNRLGVPAREIFDGPHVVFFDEPTLRLAMARVGFAVTRLHTRAYAPERSGQAPGLLGAIVRGLDLIGPLYGGRFRLLVMARDVGVDLAEDVV